MTRKTSAKNSKGHKSTSGDSPEETRSYITKDNNDSIPDSSVTKTNLPEIKTLPNLNSLIKRHVGSKEPADLDNGKFNYQTSGEKNATDCKDIRLFNINNSTQHFDFVNTKALEGFNKTDYLYGSFGESKEYKDRSVYGQQENIALFTNDFPDNGSSSNTLLVAGELVRGKESHMKFEDKTCDDHRTFVNHSSSHHLELLPAVISPGHKSTITDDCESHRDLTDYNYQNQVSSWEHESDRFVEYSWRNELYSQNLFMYGNNRAESNDNVYVKNNGHTSNNHRTDNSYNQTFLGNGSCGHLGASSRRRRRRVQTPVQRTAANMRERRRMCHLNVAFEHLKERLPSIKNKQRLSRIQTLKAAIDYIHYLRESLNLC